MRACLTLVNLLIFAGVMIFTAGCSHNSTQTQVPSGSQAQQTPYQKQMTQNMQIDQINESSLPPDQKQRLIQQVQSQGSKGSTP